MAKTKLNLIALCDQVIQGTDNKATLVGLFDRIFFKKLPDKAGKFFMFAVIEGDPKSEHKLQIEVINPVGKNIGGIRGIDSKFGENGRTNFSAEMTGMPAQAEGKYTLLLKADGEQIGSTIVEVINLNDTNVGPDNSFSQRN